MKPINVVCIKWGDKYPAYYVNRLHGGVKRFMRRPFRFICFTEKSEGIDPAVEVQPLPVEPFEEQLVRFTTTGTRRGAWRKVCLYQPGLAGMRGPVLGLDVDVAITGPLDELVDFAPGKVAMRRDWLEQRRMRPGANSSVFRFDPSLHSYIYEEFAADPEGCVSRARRQEQRHTSLTALAHGDLEYFPGHWIRSFKRDSIPWPPLNHFIEPKIPADARVVCFHGRPKMDEALVGHRGGFTRSTLPARWLERHWVAAD